MNQIRDRNRHLLLMWREWLRDTQPTVRLARENYPFNSNPKKNRETRRRYIQAVKAGIIAN